MKRKLSVMSASINIILDTRRIKLKTSTYPVKLRVTFERRTKNYQTIFHFSCEDYEKLSAPRISAELQSAKNKLKTIKNSSEEFIKGMFAFNFLEFERNFVLNNQLLKARMKQQNPEVHGQSNCITTFDFSPYYNRFPILSEDHFKPGTISQVYNICIKRLLEEERIGSALSYQHSYNSIKKFRGNVLFVEVTVSYLYQYEKWMLGRGCSRTTVGIKLRALRAVFNEAIEMKIIKREECYPFGKRKYRIPTGRNIKKSLDQDQVRAIYNDQPDCLYERKAKDFWLFCYFGNGMNPKDLVYLKFKNIEDGYLSFIRAKTERTTGSDSKPISVYITNEMFKIIDDWGNKNRKVENYIFPIMQTNLNPLQQYVLVTAFTKFINDNMLKIAKRLGIDKKVTTIVSRHTFSTQLKRCGASTEFIQEALGHTDKRTTENYLDSFERDVKKEFAMKLLQL